METTVYRQQIANEMRVPEDESGTHRDWKYPGQRVAQQAYRTLITPAIFYPVVSDQELEMRTETWRLWGILSGMAAGLIALLALFSYLAKGLS